jgi:tetratricopeptide (TPR) repeat protein
MRRLLWCWILLPLVTAGSGWAGEAQWLEVKSPHFSVVTDDGEKRGREVAVRFEQMRAVFAALLVKTSVNIPTPLQIVAFRSSKEMRQFAPLWQGKPTQVAGLFQYSDDRSFILLDMSTLDPWQVVLHEYGHLLLNGNTSGQMQPWFDEGFAEYFSTIRVSGKEADVGLPPPDEVAVLRDGSWLKIADLFKVEQNSSTYNENGDHRTMFYAESWLVVHYLYDKQLIPKMVSYFTLVFDDHLPVEQAIQQAFGMTPETWDKELRRYFNSGVVRYYKLTTPPGIETTGYTTRVLSFADSKALLADMHLHSADYQNQAIEEFEEVLTVEPDNVAALRGLGYAYLRKQSFSTAADYFQKAAARDSKDPRVLYYSARLRNEEKLDTDPQQLEITQKELERSIALDPNFADAYSLLAFTYHSQGRYEDAQGAMLHAVALNPRNDGYAYNLAQMYLANGNAEAAEPILERLKNSTTNPQIAMMASSSLVQMRAYKSGPVGVKHFLKGKVVSVDCSAPPAAVLTIAEGSKTRRMVAEDRSRLAIMGGNFSCDWKGLDVGVNYRTRGDGVDSIESLQLLR